MFWTFSWEHVSMRIYGHFLRQKKHTHTINCYFTIILSFNYLSWVKMPIRIRRNHFRSQSLTVWVSPQVWGFIVISAGEESIVNEKLSSNSIEMLRTFVTYRKVSIQIILFFFSQNFYFTYLPQIELILHMHI